MDPIVTLRELERLEHMVEEAKGVLGFIRIDVDEFMMIVNKIRGSLPSEMKEAVVIREKRDEIIGAAHHEADSRVGSARNEAEQTKAAALAEAGNVVDAARAEAQRLLERARLDAEGLVSKSEVVRMSQEQAREIIRLAEEEAARIGDAARAESQQMCAGADSYAADVLNSLEASVGMIHDDLGHRIASIKSSIQKGRAQLDHRNAGRPNR